MHLRIVTGAFGVALLASPSAAALGSTPPDASSSAAVASIERTARAIAAGAYGKEHDLRTPARDIAIAWQKAGPAYLKDGDTLVESHRMNSTIETLEDDWRAHRDRARGDAKLVVDAAHDLLDAAKSASRSATAAPAGTSPAASPAGTSPAGTASPAASDSGTPSSAPSDAGSAKPSDAGSAKPSAAPSATARP